MVMLEARPPSLRQTGSSQEKIATVMIGRKNWLFADSDVGGDRAAVIYSLIETVKMQGLDPRKYLSTVLNRISDHPIKDL
jgi:hypothetical protein